MQLIKANDFCAYNFGRLSILAFESVEDLKAMAERLTYLAKLNDNAGDGTGYTRYVTWNQENKDFSKVSKDEYKDALRFGDIFIEGRTSNLPLLNVAKGIPGIADV